MKTLKGVSARLLNAKHRNVIQKHLWGGHIWSPLHIILQQLTIILKKTLLNIFKVKGNKMKKDIVVRLYLPKEQQDLFIKSFGCARFIYNTLLDYAKENKEYNRFNSNKVIILFLF